MIKNSDMFKVWFHEVWNSNRLDRIDELLSPDVKFGGTLDSVVAPGVDYKEVVSAVKSVLHHIHVTITHQIDQDDLSSVRVEVIGTDASGKTEVCFTGQVTARIREGKFVEFLSNFDYLSMFEQLGQLPPDTFPICLTGDRLIWASHAASSDIDPFSDA